MEGRLVRPDRNEWHLKGALWLAEMGDCTRRKVGALIVGPDKRIWGMGYNGTYADGPSCLKGDCPRGRHYEVDHLMTRNWRLEGGAMVADKVPACACGNLWPCPDAVTPGSSYDTGPGACISTHAEGNAKTDAMRRGGGHLDGCTMFVSCEPCEGCTRDLRNTTGIGALIWPHGAIGLP
jgi:dCMP deaminase